MPIYEYKCPSCKKEFEELIYGNNVPVCPDCGEKQTEKLISSACVRGDSNSSSRGGCGGCSGGNCGSCR